MSLRTIWLIQFEGSLLLADSVWYCIVVVLVLLLLLVVVAAVVI